MAAVPEYPAKRVKPFHERCPRGLGPRRVRDPSSMPSRLRSAPQRIRTESVLTPSLSTDLEHRIKHPSGHFGVLVIRAEGVRLDSDVLAAGFLHPVEVIRLEDGQRQPMLEGCGI